MGHNRENFGALLKSIIGNLKSIIGLSLSITLLFLLSIAIIPKLHRVQRQSVRFIKTDFSCFSSVSNMLIDLNIPSLEHRRQVSSITLLYKIVHNLIDISNVDLIPVTSNTRGHDQRFHHIYARTNQYSNSFFPRSIKLWNSLPPDLTQQQSLQIFKHQLKLLVLSPTNQ